MSERCRENELHDLKASIADFFIYMSLIEATIEKLFRQELLLSDNAAKLILKEVRSVEKRWNIIKRHSENRPDTAKFKDLIDKLEMEYKMLRDIRNECAHSLSENEARMCLSYTKKGLGPQDLTGPTMIDQMQKAEEISHQFSLLVQDLEHLDFIYSLSPTEPVEVIRDAYRHRLKLQQETVRI